MPAFLCAPLGNSSCPTAWDLASALGWGREGGGRGDEGGLGGGQKCSVPSLHPCPIAAQLPGCPCVAQLQVSGLSLPSCSAGGCEEGQALGLLSASSIPLPPEQAVGSSHSSVGFLFPAPCCSHPCSAPPPPPAPPPPGAAQGCGDTVTSLPPLLCLSESAAAWEGLRGGEEEEEGGRIGCPLSEALLHPRAKSPGLCQPELLWSPLATGISAGLPWERQR